MPETVFFCVPASRSTWRAGVRAGEFLQPEKIGVITALRIEDINNPISTISGGSALYTQRGGE